MRNIRRIFRDDMRLAGESVVSILVVLGLCLAPALFAWFNIAGSWNPYDNTSALQIAVASNDEGHESDLVPVRVNIGDRVIDELRANSDYSWVFVDEDTALEGTRSGKYYAAIVIPADFSSKMLSVFSTDTERATVLFYLNLKDSPQAATVADEGGSATFQDVRAKFTDAIDNMALGLADDMLAYIDSDKMQNYGVQLAQRLGDVADNLDAVAEQVRSFSSLAEATTSLTAASAQALLDANSATDASYGVIAGAAEDIEKAVDSAQSAASSIRQQVSTAKSDWGIDEVGDTQAANLASDVASLASSVDSIESDAAELSESLKSAAESLSGSTSTLASNLDRVRSSLGVAANQLGASASKIRKFRDDIAAAIAKGNTSLIAGIVGSSSASLAQWLAAPIDIEQHAVFPVENYGSSVAPFYLVLSLWAGALLLIVVMKVRVSESRLRCYEDELGSQVKPHAQYAGRLLTFAVLALAQATVTSVGALLFLQVQSVYPLLLIVGCWACALAFICIEYMLTRLLGKVGIALCLALLVVLVAGASGVIPVALMGDVFDVVYLFTPFPYATGALQAAIAGFVGAEYLMNVGLLMAFLIVSLIVGLAVRRSVSFG